MTRKATQGKANTEPLDVLAWLETTLPDTPEMQAIELEERTKFNLASALIRAREAAGHTQTTLATEIGVRQSLISKWENINHNHTLETLLALCQATGANLVLGLEVQGELVPVTSAAERCILTAESNSTQHESAEQEKLPVKLLARNGQARSNV